MELPHKGLGHVRSGAPPTRGPRKAHPTQVLRLGFEERVPRTQAAGIRPRPTLPRGDGLAAEKGSLVGAAWIGFGEGPALTVWLGDPAPDANNPLLNRVHRSAPQQLFETDTR
jgi:hypothetical protein